jgi:predicted phage terminase large subunit-like protein
MGYVANKIAKGYPPNLLGQMARERLHKIQSTKPPKIEEHWRPHPGPQAEFFYSECREILYGGAAGGGKSAALTALPGRWAHKKGFLAVTFRRETTQLDDLIKKAKEFFSKLFPGIRPVHTPHFRYTFPAGGESLFRHLNDSKDFAGYDGWQINLLCFDELTHFTEQQYKALCARVRCADPSLPRLIRSTSNPGGEGHEWVKKHWGAWLDPKFEAPGLPIRFAEDGVTRLPPAKPGEVWWIRTIKGREEYFRECVAEPGKPITLSRTFIPAKLSDNPSLEADVEYRAQLESLDAVRREQLIEGNWLARYAAGLLFKRSWVEILPERPPGIIQTVRAWDLASTEKSGLGSDNPDYTSGVLMGLLDGMPQRYVVLDVVRGRWTPGQVLEIAKQTAVIDGPQTAIFIAQDPGQAGKFQIAEYAKHFDGYRFLSSTETGSKIQRFSPFSSVAEPRGGAPKGRVLVVAGHWTSEYLAELEAFPDPSEKDDQVDSTSNAFKALVSTASVMDAFK